MLTIIDYTFPYHKGCKMNKKLFALSIFAVAFAVTCVFAAPNGALAASDNYNNVAIGSVNLFGVDETDNAIAAPDRDTGAEVSFPSYGLQGSWEPGQM